MEDWRRRIGLALTAVAAIILTYSVIYQWAMLTFEGQEIPIYKSIQVVIESLTTAGFGGHAPWESTVLNFLVIGMNVTGVLLVFLGLPLFAIPLLRQGLKTEPPTTSDLTDHVIICGHSARDDVLRKELDEVGIPCVFIEQDPDLVTELAESGIDAIHGDPEQIETLRAANATDARSLVADVNDEANPTVILSALRINPDLGIISVVRDYKTASYHEYSGADEVVLARQQLGDAFGRRATTSFAEKLRNVIHVENDYEITELLVEEESDLAGQTIREAHIFGQTDLTIIGVWLGGKFVISPDPDTVLEENTILLVAGEHSDFDSLTARSIPTHHHPSHVIICGYGTVGWSVAETLEESGISASIIDRENRDAVDVVGDATDPETYEKVDIENAETIVLSLDDDTTTIYSTLVIRELAPDIEIIARADDPDTVWKLYNAGADYVLSLPTITGEILASYLIDKVEIVTPQVNFEFIRSKAPSLVGESLSDVDLRRQTGCTVIAVERDDELKTDLSAGFVVSDNDILIAGGSEKAIENFKRFVTK
ncbi:Trk K+ transport system, NAD-binding component [Natronorubrum sediminis]|uniref:Trk K+ transport system, NAD-binding component n=1 Tax=Natronorubrum sediminis TaxID=640943 RepID=A0A1H6G5N1_9EURY|nr:NAD-binding protein [Natronorubrum sediminis]SEH17930.1 Trk K+ transport system, NAD-binding component [Natronorubrum sediminis]